MRKVFLVNLFMMRFRFTVSGLHLLASVCILSLVIGGFYLGWYGWPGWYLLGADNLVGILVLVDVGLGPLATLVVSNPTKPRKELRRDIVLIVLIQMAALGYGAGTLWMGRPLYYAFSVDRIQIVPAGVFDEQTMEKARKLDAQIMPSWSSLPQWIWTALPENPDELQSLIAQSIFGGPDIVSMPQYFRPIGEATVAMREQFLPLRVLLDSHSLSDADYRELIPKLGRPESELGVLPVQGRTRDGAWIFDRTSGEPLAFHPVVVWGMKSR